MEQSFKINGGIKKRFRQSELTGFLLSSVVKLPECQLVGQDNPLADNAYPASAKIWWPRKPLRENDRREGWPQRKLLNNAQPFLPSQSNVMFENGKCGSW